MHSDTWGTEEDEVFVGFVLENKSNDLILSDVEYTISLQDSTGQEISQDWNIFPTLFPGQKLGIFYQTSLGEDDPPVEKIDISYDFEDSETPDGFENPFTAEKV